MNKKRWIALILCVVLIASYGTYRFVSNGSKTTPSGSVSAPKAPAVEATNKHEIQSSKADPSIQFFVYGEPTERTQRLIDDIGEGVITDIQSLVSSNVAVSLEEQGFISSPAVAETLDESASYSAGVCYRNKDIQLFNTDALEAVGYVQVVSDTAKFEEPDKNEAMLRIMPEDAEAGTEYICTYICNDIEPGHFVYQGKYVTYYQQSPMRIVYKVEENKTANYDITLGSLYDFDKNCYIFDLALWESYSTHAGITTLKATDYAELSKELQAVAAKQTMNGYSVEEYRIVYISPESIQAYLDSGEEDTFFGYSVKELSESFGYGRALRYTDNGFEAAQLVSEENYDWKTFLTKVGVGMGIMIIGCALAPVTAGASFSCALITAVEMTTGASLAAALGTLTLETCRGLVQGKSFEEALKNASHKGLDQFANTFLVMSIVTSAGIATGAIKPTACFPSSTKIAVLDSDGQVFKKNIEKITVGDDVLTWDEDSKTSSVGKVSRVFERAVDETICLTISGQKIETTSEHPFFLPEEGIWESAGKLEIGAVLQCEDGRTVVLQEVSCISFEVPETVYNFEVTDGHSYFVGEPGILVHNTCDNIIQYKKQKAVKEAWKQEREAVLNHTSKYNWSPEQIEELLTTEKISDIEGHHIKTVRELINTTKESLIADPNNIVFLTHDEHLLVHDGCFLNPTNMDVLLELRPWAAEQLALVA